MPNIPVFEAGTGQLAIPEGGAAAFTQVGRRAGQFYHQIGQDVGQGIAGIGEQVEQHDTMMAISKGAAAGTGLHASLTEQAAKAIGDNPEDSTAPQKFLQQTAEPAIEDFLKQFDGSTPRAREWARNYADGMRQQVSAYVAALGSFAAGQATEVNAKQTANNLQQQVMSQGTVGAYNDAVGTFGGIIDNLIALHPNLSGEDRVKLKTSLLQNFQESTAKSLVAVTAMKNPDLAEKMVDSGAFGEVLNAGETKDAIQRIARQRKTDATNARILANQEAQMLSERTAGGLLASVVDPVTHEVKMPADWGARVLQLAAPGGPLKPSEAKALFEFSKSPSITKQNLDPEVYADLWHRTGDKESPTTISQITAERKAGTITDGQFGALMRHMESGQKGITKVIASDQAYKYEIAKAAGMIQQQEIPSNGAVISAKAQFGADTLAILAQAGQNWRMYLDPHDPKYLFTPERIQQYRPTKKELMQGLVTRRLGGQAPAANGRPPLVFNFNLPPKGQ